MHNLLDRCLFSSGWNELFFGMLDQLNNISINWHLVYAKERDGGLACYFSYQEEDEEKRRLMEAVVRAAEDESRHVCEICGGSGQRHGFYHWRTLCDKHGAVYDADQQKFLKNN